MQLGWKILLPLVAPAALAVAALNFNSLLDEYDAPAFLSPSLRAAVKAGGALGPVVPGVVVPAAKRALREMVGHLLVDATEAKLGASLARIRRAGSPEAPVRLNLNLLGDRQPDAAATTGDEGDLPFEALACAGLFT